MNIPNNALIKKEYFEKLHFIEFTRYLMMILPQKLMKLKRKPPNIPLVSKGDADKGG
jgi:hypothetical protein